MYLFQGLHLIVTLGKLGDDLNCILLGIIGLGYFIAGGESSFPKMLANVIRLIVYITFEIGLFFIDSLVLSSRAAS